MGSYNFRWERPASDVYVTGTFDNWGRSIKLDRKHLVHERLVELPPFDDKVFFKYVVDGEWQLDHSHPTEKDHEGNTNNVLYPDELGPSSSSAHPVISSVAPGASTIDMAGKQPLQRRQTKDIADVPGAFPETPAPTAGEDEKKNGLAAAAGVGGVAAVGAAVLGSTAAKKEEEQQTFSVNPIPASEGAGNPIHLAPGEKVPDSSTFNPNTIQSTVRDDPSLTEEKTFGVAPIPATGGTGNPIHLAPGEPVPDPSTITGNTLTSNVKLDQAAYDKSDAGAPVLPPVVTPSNETATVGLIPALGPQITAIPESGLPMGKNVPPPINEADLGPHITSTGPTSTTAQLAGQVPLEPRGVPQVVEDSQRQAHVEPEASANPTAVEEKKEVENELQSKIPKEQSGSGGNAGIAAAVGGGLAALGAAAVTAAVVVREKTHEATGTDPVTVLPQSVQDSINSTVAKPATATTAPAAPAAPTAPTGAASGVPPEVKESQQAAHVDPEASANPEAVHEKAALENELLKKVPESQAVGEPAPTAAAATSATAPAAQTSSSGAPQLGELSTGGGMAPLSFDEKPTATSGGLNAPATAPAQTGKPVISRDVSPKSSPTATQSQPTVTTGVGSSTVPAQSTPPNKKRHSFFGGKQFDPSARPGTADTTGTESVAAKKKKGFFAKLKQKLSHHD